MDQQNSQKEIPLPDTALSTMAQSRDKQLFIQLYDYFAPRLKRYLVNLGASDAIAEELLQETLLAVWYKCDSYNPAQAAASTWIFRIARNQWIDYLRKMKPHLFTAYELYPPMEQETVKDEEAAYADKTPVKEVLRQLPVIQAQLIYKSYYEGQSHRDIALALDMPLGSVKSGLRLAFKKLRKALGTEQ
ncbi:sigma-70 family RNA polymerase sigma factor [Candidatus Sororendozoicomonas aggregata]|uniref:sigma-70 family RNA polymerase sigma factor n=1 Tax=Candidatus Sororendozoicomonas aggregata TaxID=3073239 RepID=UPI002ED1B737